MMHVFLYDNRSTLLMRCVEKVAKRPHRNASAEQLVDGIPLFLSQLTRTLKAENGGDIPRAISISGPSGDEGNLDSEIGVSAAAHGKELLRLGYTVDQVVHDYGDLCQAITDLAFECDAPFSIEEFRTLNRCLDNAIADAVVEFSAHREMALSAKQSSDSNERFGFLMHELRNSLHIAKLAVAAISTGNLGMGGATAAVLNRSHMSMEQLIGRSLSEVQNASQTLKDPSIFTLEEFVAEAAEAARLEAIRRGCLFEVCVVDPSLVINGHRDALLGALANLLQNAFKFTRPQSTVTLEASAESAHVIIEVSDQCGGLPQDDVEKIFAPFSQRNNDKSGLGLGLAIARQSVVADGGTLTVQNMPGTGCVFVIRLPRLVE